jgi:hypothetical protein
MRVSAGRLGVLAERDSRFVFLAGAVSQVGDQMMPMGNRVRRPRSHWMLWIGAATVLTSAAAVLAVPDVRRVR